MSSMARPLMTNEDMPLSVGQRDRHQMIAERMETLAIELRTMSDHEIASIPTRQTLQSLSVKIYTARRRVDEIFGMCGFAVSPAWDIMLDLYHAKCQGKTISVTSACIGAACAATTGLRWLQALENRNLLARSPDPNDKRRHVVELTEGGQLKVEQALVSYL